MLTVKGNEYIGTVIISARILKFLENWRLCCQKVFIHNSGSKNAEGPRDIKPFRVPSQYLMI